MARTAKGPTGFGMAVQALKAMLKAGGWKYADLAQHLGISESGLKKYLGGADGSFQRLALACDFLGINLGDLLAHDHEPGYLVTFSDDQEKLLMENQQALKLYWKLVYERRDKLTSFRLLGISQDQGHRLLRALDKVNLITLLPGDRLRVPAIHSVTWSGKNRLVKQLRKDWGRKLVEELCSNEAMEEEGLLQIRYFQMSPRTYREFLLALRNLEQEFLARAVREMRMKQMKLEHIRWVSGAHCSSFI